MTNTLKYKTETTNFIEDGDLCAFLTREFALPRPFELLEASNDSDHAFNLDGAASDEDRSVYNHAREKGRIEVWRLRAVLQCLTAFGYLAPGKCVVRVSW